MIWGERSVEFVHFTINLEKLNFLINQNVPLPGITSPNKDSSFLSSVALTRSKLSGRSDGDIPDMYGWLDSYSGVGSVATRTLEWKVKIHQHLLNQSWLNFKICLLH